MGKYKYKLNALSGEFDLVGATLHFKDSVASYSNLPTTGNTENDSRFVRDTDKLYTWSISSSSGNLSDWKEVGSFTAHASSHQDTGGDEINVAGLSGELADPQPPKSHNHVESDVTDLDHYDSADFTIDFAAEDLANLATKSYNDLTDKPDLSDLHAHANKALLDTYTQTEVDIADAVSKKHNESHTHLEVDITNLDHDATKINGVPVDAPASGEDGEVLTYNESLNKYELKAVIGTGDMLKSVYDTGDNGIVDNSEKLEGSTKAQVQDHTPKAHTHVELDITDLDHYDSADFATDFGSADLANLGTKSYNDLTDKPDLSDLHNHANKALLDTYDQTNADITDAVSKKHNEAHTHLEIDITDLDHDALKIKGITVDDSGIGTGKYLKYDGANLIYDTPAGAGGDMLKSIYDIGDNGIVDKAEALNDGSSGDANNCPASEVRDHLDDLVTDRKHLTDDQEGAAENADTPSSSNPFVTASALVELAGIVYVEDESESTTTDDVNWQQKLRLTFTPPEAGDYWIHWSVEAANSGANKGTYIQLEQDDTTQINTSLNAPIVANGYLNVDGFKKVTLDTSQHTFDIDFMANTSTSTAKVRRARLAIRKI